MEDVAVGRCMYIKLYFTTSKSMIVDDACVAKGRLQMAKVCIASWRRLTGEKGVGGCAGGFNDAAHPRNGWLGEGAAQVGETSLGGAGRQQKTTG